MEAEPPVTQLDWVGAFKTIMDFHFDSLLRVFGNLI
jgi:hypothetical protein